ncbi:MAG: GDP-mannose 4,6-dehydratase [Firmicutes bacterium]|nr:GDP-mannose 4,6-dehydratase [Bacillota bacterium]
MTRSFWSGRRVLVTGATGFVGSWLVQALVDAGSDVVCLVRDRVPGSWLVRSGYIDRVTVVSAALEDHHLERVLAEYEVETVFHLAAQTIVGTANRSPLGTFEANVRGTWNILEAARARRDTVHRVVVASTDKAYGEQPTLPYTEDMPLRGRHPYDVSKSCADLIAQAYFHTYGLPVGIARCGNIYGGGDLNFNRVIPGTIRAALAGERPVVRSDGSLTRDYLYVKDAVRGYLALGEALDQPGVHGEAFNFGTGRPVSVREVVATVLSLCGRPDLEPVVLGQAVPEIPHQWLSAEKAHRVLGWRAEWALEAGLAETIAWYRAYLGTPVDRGT